MSLQECINQWHVVENLKLAALRSWQIPDSTSPSDLQNSLALSQRLLSECWTSEPILREERKLTSSLAQLSPEDFKRWKLTEFELHQTSLQTQTEILQPKIIEKFLQ